MKKSYWIVDLCNRKKRFCIVDADTMKESVLIWIRDQPYPPADFDVAFHLKVKEWDSLDDFTFLTVQYPKPIIKTITPFSIAKKKIEDST